MRAGRPAVRATALAACILLVAGSCTGDDASSATPTSAVATEQGAATTAPTSGQGDGEFRIGVLVPTEGERSEVGRGVVRGVNLAVEEVNSAGGVAGLPVQAVVRNEPTDPLEAGRVVRELVREERIDALVGPASSSIALAVLDQLVAAEVLTCSPTATTSELTTFPDNGLFVRTIGTERAEAVALAEVVQASGESSTAILYADDDYGLAMADDVTRALPASVDVVGREAYDQFAAEFQGPVRRMIELDPATLVVIGSGDVGAQVIADALEASEETEVFVSSGLRSRLLSEVVAPGAPDVLEGVEGVAPRAAGVTMFEAALAAADPGAPTAFAAHAYDCVNLLALASHLAGGDDGLAAAARLGEVSETGSPCDSFPECVDLVGDGRDVDLEGATGPLGLDDAGDVTVAVYDRFRYMGDGQDRTIGTVTVTMGVPVP